MSAKQKIFKLSPSHRKNKKFMIETPDGTSVHFGDCHYEDYTIHQDEGRKSDYISRHSGSGKQDWTINGIYKAGFWSRWLLWEENNLLSAIDNIENKFNIRIIYTPNEKLYCSNVSEKK